MIFNLLDKFGKRWLKELPAVIWSLRTSRSRATRFTPFFMVYGSEAVLPTDLEYGSPRVQAYDENSCKTFQEDALDQLDEATDVALLHSAKYQQALRRYHTRRIRGRAFQVGDLVLRLRQSNKGRHKLTPPGKDLSSSPKSSDPALTSSPTKQGRSSRSRGTENNYVASTLRIL